MQTRTERELRPSPGHGARFDPEDPASWHDVERLYDGGQCAERGECPDGWRCVVVATCRPEGDNDSAIAANGRYRGTEAVRAWHIGRPFATAAPEPLTQEPQPPSPAPEEPSGEPAPEEEETEATPTEFTSGGATDTPPTAGCGCIVSGRPRTSSWPLVAIVLFVLRRRRP